MEYLIKRGVPMRTGHETVGKLVAQCEANNQTLAQLTLDEFREHCEAVEQDVYDVLGTENAMKALTTAGSGGRKSVEDQLSNWQKRTI